MMEKDRFIAALLPFCDTVCEYDRSCGKLRVCKTGLAQGISDKWYSVDELRNIFRDGCAVSAEKDVWTRYLSGENLRGFFDGNTDNDSFRLRLRQGGQAYRQYDIRIDRVDDNVLVISGRDTQEQEQDVLTGALSRNHYERDMSAEAFHGGVALVDMDDLKLYNDVYGHSVGDKALWALAEVIRRELGTQFCRRCNYCQPCTAGIAISGIFVLEGYLNRYGLGDWAKQRYAAMGKKAGDCVGCGACEKRCPYQLPIRQMLARCKDEFGA